MPTFIVYGESQLEEHQSRGGALERAFPPIKTIFLPFKPDKEDWVRILREHDIDPNEVTSVRIADGHGFPAVWRRGD